MPNDDLISRDAAKNIVSLMVCAPTIKIAAEHEIDDLPGFDAVPVVHGRWEFCGDDYLVCGVCGARYYKVWLIQSYCTGPGSDQMDGFLYCPHCNALLDGGENQ